MPKARNAITVRAKSNTSPIPSCNPCPALLLLVVPWPDESHSDTWCGLLLSQFSSSPP